MYAPLPPQAATLADAVPLATLTGLAARLARMTVGVQQRPGPVAGLLREGALDSAEIDGVRYLWPAERPLGMPLGRRGPPALRFLAPFDPLVWDRRRFAHLWGWEYRFEAYTPPARRVRGYYALPLLWGEAVVGWVNVTRTPRGLDMQPGFIAARPDGPDFARAFDAEVAAMRSFLTGAPGAPVSGEPAPATLATGGQPAI